MFRLGDSRNGRASEIRSTPRCRLRSGRAVCHPNRKKRSFPSTFWSTPIQKQSSTGNIALLVETVALCLSPASALRWPEILGLDAFEPLVFAKACVNRAAAIGANRLEKGSPSRGFDAPKLVHSRGLEAFWSFHIPVIGHSGQSARRRSV
jgi:hypothetical protein